MTVGSEFEGVKPTPPGGRSEARSKGVKKEARGFDPPTPRQIEPWLKAYIISVLCSEDV